MHTFCQFIHKQTCESNELYHFSTLDNKSKNLKMDFCKLAYNIECKPNTDISFEEDFSSRLLKIFFLMYAVGPINYSIQSKLSYFKKTIDNIFMTPQQRESFINKFCGIQRNYWLINRLVYRYKWRKAPIRVKNDLILTPIQESQSNVVTIMHNNTKYLFTVLDLKNIIEGALSNSPFLFSSPLAPKNPYNNIAFDKATLYNIYFFMKQGNFVLSNLFHNYFLCNFSLRCFRDENEVIIRKKHIDQYSNNMDIDELYADGLEMLTINQFTKRLRIDVEFPKSRFVKIIKPYLNIYYRYLYSLNISERNSSLKDLNTRLKQFYFFNPKFGRRSIRIGKGSPNVVGFNDACINFCRNSYVENYSNSHLDVEIEDTQYDDEEESIVSEMQHNYSNFATLSFNIIDGELTDDEINR
jgi:hypothetical protein